MKDVATEEELEEIQGLRDMMNQLVNDMPEVTQDCPIGTCGRKFKKPEELQKHLERRHGQPPKWDEIVTSAILDPKNTIVQKIIS